jgi:hypothetical protein
MEFHGNIGGVIFFVLFMMVWMYLAYHATGSRVSYGGITISTPINRQRPRDVPKIYPVVPQTYTYQQGMDSAGKDIMNSGLANDIPALKTWCDARPLCAGFNTDGWMKRTISTPTRWLHDTPENMYRGLYVKTPV